MKIPLDELSAQSLMGIIENFVLREGTDYGSGNHDLATKCAQVRQQLEAGEADIWFDARTQSVDIRLNQ